MTAIAARVPCPVEGCTYTMDSPGSIPAHVAMVHPEVPMDAVSPKRSARNGVARVATTAQTVEATDAPPLRPWPSPAAAPAPSVAGVPPTLPIAAIVVEDNVREDLGEVEGLVASIREHGLLQAVLVDRRPDGAWRLVDGHRRLEACRLAELGEIPIQVAPKAFEAGERTTVQIVANSHRRDLDAIEEARGFARILKAQGITQADLARRLSKAPSTIANRLRLLELDAGVQEAISSGSLSAAHGVAIASLPPKQQREMATAVVDEKLSAHALEQRLAWKQTTAQREAKDAKQLERLAPKAIAALEAAGVAKTTAVIVHPPFDPSMVATNPGYEVAIRKAGWRKSEAGTYGWREGCDCDVVELTFDRTWKVRPACTNRAHIDRALNAERQADAAARKAADREAARLLVVCTDEIGILPPTILRLLWKACTSYYYSKPPVTDQELASAIAGLVVQRARQDGSVDDALARMGLDKHKLNRLGLEEPGDPSVEELEALGISREFQEAVARGEAEEDEEDELAEAEA